MAAVKSAAGIVFWQGAPLHVRVSRELVTTLCCSVELVVNELIKGTVGDAALTVEMDVKRVIPHQRVVHAAKHTDGHQTVACAFAHGHQMWSVVVHDNAI